MKKYFTYFKIITLFILIFNLCFGGFMLPNTVIRLGLIFHYLAAHLFIQLLMIALIIFTSKKEINKILKNIKQNFFRFLSISIPPIVKIILFIVIIGNLYTIVMGSKPQYPFYDVGMFRQASSFQNMPETVYASRYFYVENGVSHPINLRKIFVPFHEIKISNEVSFAIQYHNKSDLQAFKFIQEHLSPSGEKLYLGIETVNFKTGDVNFIDDKCLAIAINDNKIIYYGKAYIPPYQYQECGVNNE